MRKIMIIGVGWEQLPLLEKAKSMGFKTVVTTMWHEDRVNADVVYKVDSRDLNRLDEIFDLEKPDAVISDECDYSMYAVAYLTDKHKLAGPGLHPLTITNNKYLQRYIGEQAHIIQPEYKLCWNIEMAKEAAGEIGYPVVVKPVDNRGSIGVCTVIDEAGLESAWYTAIASSHSRMCLVERFIEGKLIAVDGFIDSERFNGLCVSTKLEYKESASVDKILFFPAELDADIIDNAYEATEKIIKCMGIHFGFIHAEYIIERDTGRIFLVEIANRGGGVHISDKILPEICGIDLCEALIRMSLGEKVVLDWSHEYKSKVLMYFISPKGTLGPQELVQLYEDDIIAFYIKEKSKLQNIRTQGALGRAGVVILKGKNFSEIIEKAEKIEECLGLSEEEYYYSR